MLRRFLSSNDYDSVLYAPNHRNISILQILLRVHLNPFNPGVAGATEERIMRKGRLYTFQTWKPADWQTFQVEFKRDVENYFNYPHMELWLLPTPLERLPDAAAEMQALMHAKPLSARFNAVVQCGLSVTIVPNAAASHVSFDVLRLKDDQPDFRSYVLPRRNGRDGGMLDHRDIDLWSKPRSSGVRHNSAAHEVGHVLGLGHINRNHPQCVGGNEPICYGRRGTPQHRNLMGGGNDVTTANARPWLRSMFRHTESLVWAPTTDTPKEAHFLQ